MKLSKGAQVWCQSSGVGYVNEVHDSYVVVYFIEKHAYYAEYDMEGHAVIIDEVCSSCQRGRILETEKYRSLFSSPQACIDYIKLNL